MNSKPIRLSHCLHDYVSSKERLIFTERRRRLPRWLLPLIAALLALFLMWRDVSGAQVIDAGNAVQGVDKRGAFTCWSPEKVVVQFCMILTLERR